MRARAAIVFLANLSPLHLSSKHNSQAFSQKLERNEFILLVIIMASCARRRLTASDVAAIMADSGTDVSDTDDGQTGPNATDSSESPSSSEDESFEEAGREEMLTGRDGTKWRRMTRSHYVGRTAAHNVFTANPGISPSCRNQAARSEYQAWKLFINECILRKILQHTLEEGRRSNTEFLLDLCELEAFISLTYLRGIYGRNHPLDFLFNRYYGPSVFHKTMARDRYKEILRFLRFDDKTSRRARSVDKFAPIREVFDLFAENCRTSYIPEYSLTLDEQVLPLKTRCGFIVFMPNKPDKYGLKFWLLCKVNSKYVVNIIPYLGAQEKATRGDLSLAEDVISRIAQSVTGKGYNITMDNFFTSLRAAVKLKEKRTTVVGTIRKNRKELSNHMVLIKKNATFSSDFYYHEDSGTAFVNYQCKKGKNVCLLSTMHSSPTTDTSTEKKKPEIVLSYNKGKVGVDCFDMMSKQLSTHSPCFRWPVAVWNNILDIAEINAWIIFRKATGQAISRRQFILNLCQQLSEDYCQKRERLRPRPTIDIPENIVPQRRQCQATRQCKNMTVTVCKACFRPTCGSCTKPEANRITITTCQNC